MQPLDDEFAKNSDNITNPQWYHYLPYEDWKTC